MKNIPVFLFIVLCTGSSRAQSISTAPAAILHNCDSIMIEREWHNVNVDGQMMEIANYKDRYSGKDHRQLTHTDCLYAPTRVVMTSSVTGKVLYDQIPPDYYCSFLKSDGMLSGNNALYMEQITFTTGLHATFAGDLYRVTWSAKQGVKLVKVMHADEWTNIAISSTDTHILKTESAIANTSGEGDISERAYTLYLYTYSGEAYKVSYLGKTRHVYPQVGSDKDLKDILKMIKAREPRLLDGIRLTDYR